tara:strand:- start:106 stop:444 length:339 start_codon:yes stop_codon:yes gene_type:complete
MIRQVLVVLFFLSFTFFSYPQAGLDYSNLLPLLDSRGESGQTDVEKVQAMFLQTMFVDHIMTMDYDFFDDDDEESFHSDETRNFYNSILSYEISKSLAKQDILGFKKMNLDY